MFKKLLFAFLLFSSTSYAQYSVKGELQPAENYPYMILYQLQGAKQNYVAYDSIKNGKFSIDIPIKQKPGMYRLIYDIKNRLFVDFVYAKENVALTFNPKEPKQSVQFAVSDNNKIYQDYLKATQKTQNQLDLFQVDYLKDSNTSPLAIIKKLYEKKYLELNNAQSYYEKLSKDKFVSHFIKAGARYNSNEPIKLADDYLKSVQTHFFDNIDLNSEALLNSTFINDKINNFIFYLNPSEDKEQQIKLRKEAISIVIDKIGSNYNLAKDIEEGLLHTFAQQEDIVMVNYMLNKYIQLPRTYQDVTFVNTIKGQLKTSIGVTVPNISWQESEVQKSLYDLKNAEKYIIVFWSSTCAHCLKEMPVLYDFLKDNTQTKVIALGLEEDASKIGWETMIKQYPNFYHVYGKDKWKNKYARDYGVNATPSFFVLDAQKKVLAKPDDVGELKVFFEND